MKPWKPWEPAPPESLLSLFEREALLTEALQVPGAWVSPQIFDGVLELLLGRSPNVTERAQLHLAAHRREVLWASRNSRRPRPRRLPRHVAVRDEEGVAVLTWVDPTTKASPLRAGG